MDKHIYDIWLQRVLNVRSTHSKDIISVFGSSENVYRADESSLRMAGVLGTAELARAADKNLDEAQRICSLAYSNGIDMVAYTDEQYPVMLRQLSDPPFVLYIKGTLPPLTGLKIAIVGTRRPTASAQKIAFDYAYELTRHKALIVSGGAVGVDMLAHRGVLQAGGITLCVLGHGILFPYHNGAEALREEISRHGAVISEYPPDSPIYSFSFTNRNRIIAGLSDCTLVTEAGAGSGSLLTAAYAAAQNKPIFVVPGSPDNPNAIGTNNLLRIGATMTLQYTDLLDWYDSGRMTAQAIGQRMSESEIKKIRNLKEPMPLVYLNRLENRPIVAAMTDLLDDTVSAAAVSDEEETVPFVKSGEKTSWNVISALRDPLSTVPAAENTDISDKETIRAKKLSETLLLVANDLDELIEHKSSEDEPSSEKNIKVSKKAVSAARKPRRKVSAETIVPADEKTVPVKNAADNQDVSEKKNTAPQKISDTLLTEGALSVYDTISESPTDAETIRQILGMKIDDVLSALTELELFELIRPVGLGRYVRV